MRWPLACKAGAVAVLSLSMYAGGVALSARELDSSLGARPGSAGTAADPNAQAALLVDQALAAEAEGKISERDILLARAIEAAPHYLRARWAAHHVRSGNKWLPLAEAESAAAGSSTISQYYEMRDKQSGTARGEETLANWCLQHGMAEQGKWHWRRVLDYDPQHHRALKELDLHNYNGALLTTAQRTAALREAKILARANEKWKARLTSVRRNLASDDESKRQAALASIGEINDPQVVPVFEALVERKSPDDDFSAFSLEMVRALSQQSHPKITGALARQAVLSPWEDTRTTAIAALSQRDIVSYAPEVMGLMQLPVDRTSSINSDVEGNVYYRQLLSHPGPHSMDTRLDECFYTLHHLPHLKYGYVGPSLVPIPVAVVQDHEMAVKLATERSERDRLAVERQNESTALRNANAIALLKANAEKDCGDNVADWWDWWREYNELAPPTLIAQTSTYNYQHYEAFVPCCFRAGTKVSALTGLVPIEQIVPGDRVLAQDPQTGELAYKLVLATSIRPASPLRQLTIDGEAILTTRGHRFWQLGRGWQMSKELETGALLYSSEAPVAIESVEDSDNDEAYNLTVEDFHTYFVGKHRLLAHDNTAPKSVTGSVPGLKPSPSH